MFIDFREREEVRQREGERNISVREKHWSIASLSAPTRDWTHNLGMCPDRREPGTFQLWDNDPTNWATLARAGFWIRKLIHSWFIICKFHICELASSLKFINDTKNNIALSWPFPDIGRAVKSLGEQSYTFPAEVKQGWALPSYFSSHTVNKGPLHTLQLNHFCALGGGGQGVSI